MKVEISHVLEKLAGSLNMGFTRIAPPFEGVDRFDYGLRRALDAEFDWPGFGRTLLDEVPFKTLVFARGVFELRFALLHAPDEEDVLYCLGPWADGPRSKESVAWCEKYLDEKAQAVVEEYHNRVRQLDDGSIKATLFAVASLLYPEGELKSHEWREFMPLHFRPSIESFREKAFTEDLPAELLETLQQKVAYVIAQRSVRILRNVGGNSVVIQGRLLQSRGEDFCVYRLTKTTQPAGLDKHAIRYLSADSDLPDCSPLEYYLGGSERILATQNACDRYAGMNGPVLIVGARGTGKDRFAHYIYAHSRLKQSSFVMIDVTLLDE